MSGHGVAPDQPAGPEPTLRALSRELLAARDMSLDLQEAVAELLAAMGERSAAVPFRLQNLDRLTQTLGDLAGFVGALARVAPPGWSPDVAEAAGALRLRDLAARLAGCPSAPAPAGEEDWLF